ncbi:hypothetical protein [Enterobacter hormaechei]|uniref:hypothetical protein n=1 Tax=Enterobacter hormaechei TaxID=158836 RepID=UPI003B97C29B
MQLSQKTTSTYRVRILEKLNIRSKNILAMQSIAGNPRVPGGYVANSPAFRFCNKRR